MIDSPLLTHLLTEQDPSRRLQYLLASLRHHFACDAVALLQSDGEALTPLAIDGLVQEALGRRFVVAQHPRLAALLAAEAGACFAAECDWPDPYDGLVAAHSGQPLPVHACMGMPIRVDQALWGVLTLDSLQHSAFEADALVRLRRWHDLVALTLRVNRLEAQGRLAALAVAEPVRAGTDEPPLLGQSPAFRRLLQEIDTVAASDLPVLLLGETGVGKELVARRLHAASPRQAAPLVQVNCAALPESLAESELFGHAVAPSLGLARSGPGVSKRRTVAPCFLMRSASCRSQCKPSYYARCKMAKSSVWVRTGRARLMCASSPPPTVHWPNRCATGHFAPISIIGYLSIHCRSRHCVSAVMMCCCWPAIFWSSTVRVWGVAACASPCQPRRHCAVMVGRAMCASWSMSSAGRHCGWPAGPAVATPF